MVEGRNCSTTGWPAPTNTRLRGEDCTDEGLVVFGPGSNRDQEVTIIGRDGGWVAPLRCAGFGRFSGFQGLFAGKPRSHIRFGVVLIAASNTNPVGASGAAIRLAREER